MSGYSEPTTEAEAIEAAKEAMREGSNSYLLVDPQSIQAIKQEMKDHRTMMEAFYLVWCISLGLLIGSWLA